MLACRQAVSPLEEPIHLAWWKFALLALADVEGNFFVVTAYQYTDIASATLLDCFTIPVVLVLSALVLKARYRWMHFLGVAICVAGLALLVVSDLLEKRYSLGGGSNMALGDSLVLVGASFYGLSNVGQEYVVKNHDTTEFLGMVGVFGALITGTQMALLPAERQAVSWMYQEASVQVWAYYVGFVCSLFCLYVGVPFLLQHSSATTMNLAFLTSDFWAVIAALMVFNAELNLLYFVAFGTIIAGVVIYHIAGAVVQDEESLLIEVRQNEEKANPQEGPQIADWCSNPPQCSEES